MTLSGIEIKYLINEISKRTVGYYVSNIYGITKDGLLFKLHHPEKQDILLMFSTFGLWISSVKINQIEQNRLLKRFRNDLLRLKLNKIEQLGDERVAYLTFLGFDKEFVLVGEFFGDGNILLCNKEMKILALLHSIDVRHRKLRVGLQYTPPPQKGHNIFDITKKDIEEIKTSTIPAANWVGRTLGLPKRFVEEIFHVSNIDSKTKGRELDSGDIQKIYESLIGLVNKIVNGQHTPIIIHNEKSSDISPLKLGDVENYSEVSSFMEGLDTVFTENIVSAGKSVQASSISKKINEFKTKLDEQTKAINQVKENSKAITDVAKSMSDMVSRGITSIEDIKAQKILEKNNAQLIKEKGIFALKILDEKIKINTKSSLPAIASILFDESKKQSAATNSIQKLVKKTEKEITKLSSQAKVAEESVTFSEVRKKNWFERYRWFYTSDGLLAIGGRDTSSNSAIIRKHLEKNDKVFHAEVFGSPFFILKDSNEIPYDSLNEVAHATVCFSRAWREAMYGVSAYWINPDQVKKSAPSGQYLPKGSFTIDGKRNFVKIPSLKLAVGLLKKDENFLLTCGPLTPIKKSCVCYSLIEPGGLEMTDTAKKIRNEFLKMKEDVIKLISIDEFTRILPAGKSHVVESGLGGSSVE